MQRSLRSALSHCSEIQLRRTVRKAAARRRPFFALRYEQLEHRELLTAAATITWTGGSATSSNWSDPANWDLHRAPNNGDSLVFPASAQHLANSNDISGLSVNSITFQGTFTTAAGDYMLSGHDLTVGAGGIADNGTTENANTTTSTQIDFNVALAAAQSWSVQSNFAFHQLIVNGNLDNKGFALNVTGSGTVDVTGQISGSGSLSVGGSGNSLTLDLDHANSYTGGTQVNDAVLTVSADGALGPGGGNDAGTTVTGGTLLFNAVAYNTPEAITLNGGILQGGGVSSFSGPITVTGVHSENLGLGFDGEISEPNSTSTFTLNGPTLTNNGDTNLLIEGGGPLILAPATSQAPAHPIVINSVISGTGGLTLTNVDLVLGAANTYQGATDLEGTAGLVVGVTNAIPSTSAVMMQSSVNEGNLIELGGHSDAIGSLASRQAGAGNAVDLGNGGALTMGVDNTSTTFDGNITGSGTLTKVGGGTFDLTAATDYTGDTYVSGGTFIVDGSTAAGNAVFVGPGTLGGTGTIGGTITVTAISALGGRIDPGAGPDPSKDTGTLSDTGGVTFEPSGPIASPGTTADAVRIPALAVQLGGTAANPTTDQLDSAGTVSFAGSPFLDLTALPGAGPFNPGQQFVIVQAGAPIAGTFRGLPEGSTVSDGTQNFTISYANDRVTLTAAGSPLTNYYLIGQTGDNTADTFVHNLYREVLGREDGAQEQAGWVNFYNQMAATAGPAAAQQAVVAGFLGSDEHRRHLVEVMYSDFLHRAADAGGLVFWTATLAAGVDEKNVLADIVGSEEYASDAGSTAQGWVNAVYRDLLGRAADPDGLAFWLRVLKGPPDIVTQPHVLPGIAFAFLSTPEVEHKLHNGNYPGAAGPAGTVGSPAAPGTPALGAYALADLTGNGWDNLYFQGRLDASEVDSFFAGLQSGTSYEETIAGMLDLPQFFDDTVPVIPF